MTVSKIVDECYIKRLATSEKLRTVVGKEVANISVFGGLIGLRFTDGTWMFGGATQG